MRMVLSKIACSVQQRPKRSNATTAGSLICYRYLDDGFSTANAIMQIVFGRIKDQLACISL